MSISILYGYVNIYFYTSGDHCLTSKLFESNRQHSSSNEKEEKGKERKKRFPWSRAVVLRWAQRSSRTWRTGIGHYEIVSGVPASRRAVVVPTCHRIAAQSSVGATRLARGSQLHYRAPSVTPRWFASVALCFCIRTRSSRGLPLLPLTDNWTLSMIRLSVVISRHEPHFCCKIMVPLYD